MRSVKGQYYDNHLHEFTGETDITAEGKNTDSETDILDISTPAIAQELDTTRAIEERIALADAASAISDGD